MPIGFPTGVSQGTTHTIGQVTWEWNGYAWEVVVSTIAGLSGAPGATGNTGPTGVGISGASLSNYELLITYTNGVTQNIGYIRGDTGSPGVTGSPGTAGTAGAQGNTGNTGNTGVGISGATLTNYELIFTYTTGLTQNVGYIRGETGTPGTNGATGNTGNSGVSGPRGGILYTINTSTSLVDPGIGSFRFNQSAANISGVTMMVIDYFSLGTISGTGWINTWDDGTSSNKGYLQIQNAFNNNHILILNVTSVTNMSPSTYYEVGVSYVSGTISGAATGTTFAIDFIRTGDKGDQGDPGQGLPGSTGNTGATGNGVTGFGVSGDYLYYYYTDANKNIIGDIQNAGYVRGPTGPTGLAGSGNGGAAGTKTYAVFTPLDNEPPSVNFATIDTVNSISVLDFDGTTQESAIFRSMIPEGSSFSNLLATLYFTASTSTGGVVWGVQYEKLTGGGITGDRFTGGVTGLATLSGSTSTPVGITLLSSSYAGLTAGDPYRVKVYREAANAADGLGGDAELLIVEIRGA